jgi:uncharacterized protein (TIGR02145 family)
MKSIIRISGVILIIILSHSCTNKDAALYRDPTIRDADGNIYTSVAIGNQVWLLENLRTTSYNNGDPIATTIPDTLQILCDTTSKYQWIYEGMGYAVKDYGRLYTWYAATDKRGVCPVGWHVPHMGDWYTLYYPKINNCTHVYGAEIMETGSAHWKVVYDSMLTELPTDTINHSLIATNSTGFTALPGGMRYPDGNFDGIGAWARFWSSNEWAHLPDQCYALFYPIPIMGGWPSTPSSAIWAKTAGFSIRCIKDSI